MSEPLVSCIMPTRGRGGFLEAAVACFAAQTWANRELVILEDGDRAEGLPFLAGWIKAGLSINYRFLGGRRTTGAKRNACIQLARGEYIAHFDDDDWSSPDRLETQLGALLERPLLLGTAFRSIAFWKEETGEAWRYTSSRPQCGAGTSFVYRKTAALGHPFADKMKGEDGDFLKQVGGLFHFEPGHDRIVARIHPGNTSEKVTNYEVFKPIAAADLPEGFRLSISRI